MCSVFQQAISAVSIASESSLAVFSLFLTKCSPTITVDLRQQLLRTQWRLLRRVRFRVQAWAPVRQRGVYPLTLRGSSFASAPLTDAILFSLMQYISWISNNQTAWTMKAGGTAADTRVDIGPRPVSREPMVRAQFAPWVLVALIDMPYSDS